MKKSIILSWIAIFPLMLTAQSLMLTFKATVESFSIDSVRATNMITGESTVMPGNETLMLEPVSGIDVKEAIADELSLFPNPFVSGSNIILSSKRNGNVLVRVQTIAGQELIEENLFLEQGEHAFLISIKQPGIYIITAVGGEFRDCIKAICTGSGSNENSLVYLGMESSSAKNSPTIKAVSIYTKLSYSPGDVVAFKCHSGRHTSIFTDIPYASITYSVEFPECIGPDERTYQVVKIGEYFWMAENLDYLPEVHPLLDGSTTEKKIYVYAYDGDNINEARALDIYSRYGALYNWEAANTSCPDGWHLPSEDEWNEMIGTLGSESGKKLKSLTGWENEGNGNNISCFNAIPAGLRSVDQFNGIGQNGYFWSSTPDGEQNAKGKCLMWNYDDVVSLYAGRMVGISVRCIKDK